MNNRNLPAIRLVVYFDGVCEPNPGGTACWGYVVYTADGTNVASGSGVAVRGAGATNNVAEYHALGHALRYLCDQTMWRIDGIVIRGDSLLIVKQVQGEYACNAPGLVPLRDRCLELLRQLSTDVRWEWIPREHNFTADALAGSAYEAATGQPVPRRER